MTTAIHYSSVKTPSKTGQIYGLQVAVLDMLRAYMLYTKQEKLSFLVDSEQSVKEVQEIANEIGIDNKRLQILDSRFEQNLRSFDSIFRLDTDPHDLFWQRNLLGKGKHFSFCGIAHAVSGRESAQILSKYCEAYTSNADAIICPSHSVKTVIENYFDHYSNYLFERYNVKFNCDVDLPVIPLGVNTKRIEEKVSDDKRKKQRETLNIKDEDIVLLWVGRQSYAIKAHPISMFRAAQITAEKTNKKIHLVMQGYFVPQTADKEYEALANDICKNVEVHFIASNDIRFPDGVWASGDVFLSLVDNVQESFGITPIEAIAAGLPRIISDWDGYKDHVTDGDDGFLVPTYQPPENMGKAFASLMLANREMYGGVLAQIAQTVIVDYEKASQAIIKLIENPDLRKEIVNNAKKRLPNYDWKKLIPVYEELWQRKSDKRSEINNINIVHPHAVDPYIIYKDFPTRALKKEDKLQLSINPDEIKNLLQHKMNTLAVSAMLDRSDLVKLMNGFNKPTKIEKVFSDLKNKDTSKIWCSISWLIKLGVLNKVN